MSFMLSVANKPIILSVFMLLVVMLNVVAQRLEHMAEIFATMLVNGVHNLNKTVL
jgi:cadmium resistance protein CadD (predicted permease)